MYAIYRCLFIIFFVLFADQLAAEWQRYGTWQYSAGQPFPLESHFENIDQCLASDIQKLFENHWRLRTKKEELLQLLPSESEYGSLKKEISRSFQELRYESNLYYKKALVNIFEYVDPHHIPKDLAWRLAILLPLYGIFHKEEPNETDEVFPAYFLEKETRAFKLAVLPRMEEKTDILHYAYLDNFDPDEHDLVSKLGEYPSNPDLDEECMLINFYKTSFLFFAYYFGFNDSSPSILHHANLKTIVFDSNVALEFETFIKKGLNETEWIRALQKLDQQRLEHICGLFRSFYRLLLQNRNSLPEIYVSLAAHLSSIITQALLTAQENGNHHLDAINPWMFKLYLDLKSRPFESFFLPKVQERCLKLLPRNFNLEDISEENEFKVCEAVRMRNLMPHNQGDLSKGKDIFEEFEFNEYDMRRAFINLMQFLGNRVRFAKGEQVSVEASQGVTQKLYNYLSGFIEMNDMSMTEDNALDYLLEIKLFDLLVEVWNSHYPIDIDLGKYHFGFRSFDQFYFPRTTYELRKRILKLCPYLKSYEALTTSLDPDRINEAKEQTTPNGWIEEEKKARQLCIDEFLKNAHSLFDIKEQSPLSNLVIGVRGVSAAGKSTFLKRNVLPLISPSQVEELSKGILNVDTIKAALKRLQGGTFNTQVHEEASAAFNKLFQKFAEKGSYILDMRQLTCHDVMISLVEPAKKQNHSVWLYDFDISLSACLSRILARPLHGVDPCPEYQALVDGFLLARRHRDKVLELVMSDEAITKYELYATSKQRLVAKKEEGGLAVYDLHLFKECFKEPTAQEMEKELSIVIDDTFITEAIAKGDIAEEQRETLEKWHGMSLKEAVLNHVQGSIDVELINISHKP